MPFKKSDSHPSYHSPFFHSFSCLSLEIAMDGHIDLEGTLLHKVNPSRRHKVEKWRGIQSRLPFFETDRPALLSSMKVIAHVSRQGGRGLSAGPCQNTKLITKWNFYRPVLYRYRLCFSDCTPNVYHGGQPKGTGHISLFDPHLALWVDANACICIPGKRLGQSNIPLMGFPLIRDKRLCSLAIVARDYGSTQCN